MISINAVEEQISEKQSKKRDGLTTVSFLSVCHFINDSYMNLFPPLVPFLMPYMGLNLTSVGFLTTCFAVTSSLSQILIGQITDRFGGRLFMISGPLIAAVFMSSIGLIHNYALLAVAMSIAGLGVAAFHPPASSFAGSVSKAKSGRSMSLFSMGGNLGVAAMPVIAVPLVEKFGLQATTVLAIPGILAAFLLYRRTPRTAKKGLHEHSSFLVAVKARPVQFISLLGVVAMRSLAFHGFATFLPKFFNDHGFTPMASGFFLSVLTLSGAFGGLLGGFTSDYVGRKPVIIGSLLAAIPFLNLVLHPDNSLIGLWVGIAGSLLLASFSVTVVSAQEIFPDNKAVASSLALGFGLGLGGLGVGAVGYAASSVGLEKTLQVLSVLPVLAAIFALGLPGHNDRNNMNPQRNVEIKDVESIETVNY
jgi:FSR family fosmidomycin resistance protein-like MFS transporter